MQSRISWTPLLAAVLFASACGGGGGGNAPIDSPAASGDSPTSTDSPIGGDAGSNACTSYTTSTIATMRQGAPGCYELDNVIIVGNASSKTTPTVYVEDSAGGAFAGMQVKCETTSATHPCAVAVGSDVSAATLNDSVTVKGTYIRKAPFEEFAIDSFTNNGAGTAPPTGTATLADIQEGGSNSGLYYQYVKTTLATPLKMYDWSPGLFGAQGSSCPIVFGFAMVPSTDTTTPSAACSMIGSNETAGQPSSAAVDTNEVLIGTDFYKTFETSSECKCGDYGSDTGHVVTAQSTLSGSIAGVLIFDSPENGSAYTYIAPRDGSDAPITHLQ